MDFIHNGAAHGSIAAQLLKNNFDIGAFRPWLGDDGQSYVSLRSGPDGKALGFTTNKEGKKVPVTRNVRLANNIATLRKDEWIELDKAVRIAARQRLKFVAEIEGRGLVYTIPNGLGITSFETESMSDPGEAVVSMSGTKQGRRDQPVFDLKSLPLPIIHSDFSFSARQIATSRNRGGGVDMTMAEAAARRVAEINEQMTLGTGGPSLYTFGGGTIYGATNFTSRNTYDVTAPTETGWTPQTLLNEILAMKEAARADKHYGPFMLYFGTGWEQYLDRDWSDDKGDITVRERIEKVKEIAGLESLDYLTGSRQYNILMIQMTADTIRMIKGLPLTTVQWETQGGMEQHFKVMTINVPQFRADYNGNCGIVHGAPA